MKNTLVVNIFSGPCGGKSTQAAGLFYRLKVAGYNCELVTEKAKDLTWEENHVALANQLYVSGNQIYRQERLENKVDIIITDSPFVLGICYWKPQNQDIDSAYYNLLLSIFKTKQNYNVVLSRPAKFEQVGRNHNLQQSKDIDVNIRKVLDDNGIKYDEHYATPNGLDVLYKSVLFEYNALIGRLNEKHGTP